MLRRVTFSLLNIIWKITAFVVVGIAVLVSVARLVLPGIDRYREPIAQWVSKQVAQPVEFDAITASWHGWTPVIELTNVRLRAAEGEASITRFAKAQFSLDPAKSLQRREAVPGQLIVSGLEVALARSDDGSIRLEGVNREQSGSGLKNNALAYWLQTQQRLSIEQAAITWKDDRLLKPLIFSSVALDIVSDGERRQITGRARLPDDSSEFRFMVDAQGDLLTDTWSGKMYLDGKGIDPETLLEYRRWLGLHAHGGRLDFKLWSDWRNARLENLSGEFSSSGSEVGTAARRVHIERLHGRIAAIRSQPGEWRIRVDPLQVTTANGAWPVSRASLLVKRPPATATAPDVTLNIDYLKIDDVVPVANDISTLPADLREALTALSPTGALRDLRVHFDSAGEQATQTRLSVDVEDLGVSSHRHIPAIAGLRGSIAADSSGTTVSFSSAKVNVTAPELFDRAITLDRFEGNVGLRHDGERLTFITDGLSISNADLGANIQGEFAIGDGLPPEAQLFTRIDNVDATRIKDYLPKAGVGSKTRAWFGHAFPKGHIDSGGILLHGALDKFPFDGKNGRFEARLHVIDADLLFRPKWPLVTKASGDVVFSGNSLTVFVPAADTIGADLTDTTAFIPDLFAKEKLLLIDGTAKAPVSVAKKYLLESPLKERLKEVTELLTDAGTADLQLNLRIPLVPTPNEVKGTVTLRDAVLRSVKLGADIDLLQGPLTFTDKGFAAESLKGMYAGQPVDLALKGTATKTELNAELRLAGNGDKTYLGERLHALTPSLGDWLDRHKALEHLSGSTEWEVNAQFSHRKGASTRVTDLRITSPLSGLAMNLPSPLGKDGASIRPLSIHVDLAALQERGIEFSLGDELHGALLLTDSADGQTRLKRAALRFGGTAARLPNDDTLSITGETAELSINDWLETLYERMSLGGAADNSSAPPIPVWMDVSAQRLQALGRNFENVRVRGDSGKTHWRLNVAGDTLEGTIVIPHFLKQMPTRAVLSKLHVPARAVATVTPINVNPGRLPPVSITVDDFAFQDINMGRGILSTSPVANGLKLDTMTFDSPTSSINAKGEWTLADEVHSSRFTIHVDSPGLGQLLGQFGYGLTAVEGGKTGIDIDASWAGSPADFTLEKLHGSLTMDIDNGRFLDINSPTAGRLFGLLSIQALPKRLTLDFNDLFSKGTGFEKISGNFELDGGNAYTNNLVMRGSSARIEITGRTGLAGQDYDQVATVTPQISDSLPVASAIFGPAGAGVGAAIFISKQILPALPEQIDKMLSRQYTITGSWREPKVEQVHGKAADDDAKPAPSADG